MVVALHRRLSRSRLEAACSSVVALRERLRLEREPDRERRRQYGALFTSYATFFHLCTVATGDNFLLHFPTLQRL